MRRRVVVTILAVALIGALLVAIGRWEKRRSIEIETARMRAVLTAVGPLTKATPAAYRATSGEPLCIAFVVPQNVYGLQLCFDPFGRVVETVDRRGPEPIYGSLNYDQKLSKLRVPLPVVRLLLRRAIKGVTIR